MIDSAMAEPEFGDLTSKPYATKSLSRLRSVRANLIGILPPTRLNTHSRRKKPNKDPS